jgi:linoleate 10R-lipoxygenase
MTLGASVLLILAYEAMTIQPGALPDEGLIFDSLFARQKFNPSPNKVSSIFFDWASLIIHGKPFLHKKGAHADYDTDLFQTNHRDFSISQTSSYLDLSILYGDVQEEQNHMRTFKDGHLKPDCFSEARLLAFPPACGVMLIMLNRLVFA